MKANFQQMQLEDEQAYLSGLEEFVGGRVVEVRTMSLAEREAMGWESLGWGSLPVVIVLEKDGQIILIAPLQDVEANGPGELRIIG